MNILGINGAIGWDGNIHRIFSNGSIINLRIHGSGVTLMMDGELKNALHEERFSRIKNDGNYPRLSIEKILEYNGLTKYDIDLVVYVCGPENMMQLGLKTAGYIDEKLQEYFPNSQVEFLSHHLAHASATFYTSGFDEANILTFDGAGDSEFHQTGRWLVPHIKFLQGKDLTLTELYTEYYSVPPMYESFGHLYNKYSLIAYKNKMNLSKEMCTPPLIEKLPGKVMGMAAFGDHRKIDLPEWFNFDKGSLHNSSAEQELSEDDEELLKLNPYDLAAWAQHQFEKYLLLFLSNISKKIKSDNLCLGGGCALNILANTKILEEGIYKNVHVNTAPNDDGLHFGAALHMALKYEDEVFIPDDIGYLGIPYNDKDIGAALVSHKY